MRLRGEDREPSCCPTLALGRVCDGVDQVRLAAREELRRGAHHIKIMASGGVSSPTDRLANLQVAWRISTFLSDSSMPAALPPTSRLLACLMALEIRHGHGSESYSLSTAMLPCSTCVQLCPTDSTFRDVCGEIGRIVLRRRNSSDRGGSSSRRHLRVCTRLHCRCCQALPGVGCAFH